MGKGLIVPMEYFIRKYLKQLKEDYPNMSEMNCPYDLLSKFIKKHINEEYNICSLGHDALTIRGGGIGSPVGSSENLKNVRFIQRWICLYGTNEEEKKRNNTRRISDDEIKLDDPEEYEERQFFDSLLQTDEQKSKEDLPIYGYTDLMFIGKMKTIESDGEFSYYVKAPEIIYGLTGLLDSIVQIYPTLKTFDCSDLEQALKLKPSIWTFASDCACCG